MNGVADLPVSPPISPMLAKAAGKIPAPDSVDGGLLYEPKWDGFRCLLYRSGADVHLGGRSEPLTRYFPEVVAAAVTGLPERVVLDGELVVVQGDHLQFERLLDRIHPADSRVQLLAGQHPASYVAFDLLALGDEDLTRRPFRERRALLETVFEDVQPPFHLTPATVDVDRGRTLVHRVRGRRARRRHGQAAGGALPARGASAEEGQARADGGLRGGRVPRAQVRRHRRLAPARPARRRRPPAPRRGVGLVPDGPASRARRRAGTLRDRARRAPLGS